MTATTAPPLSTVPLADLSVRDLLALSQLIRAELQTRDVDASRVPNCEHPHRRVSDMKAPDGRLVCNFCSAVSNGLKPRDVAYLEREARPTAIADGALAIVDTWAERGEYSDEWIRPTHGNPWGDL